MVVTGRVGGGTGYDYGTVKYNSNGDSLWVRIYNGPENDNDEAYSIIVDSSNNVYVTGRSLRNPNDFDIATLRYSSSGTQQWLMRYPGTGTAATTRGSIAIDKARNIFVAGSIDNGPSFRADYVTIKYAQLVGTKPISNILPGEFSISNNPNPFNSQTTISIDLPFKTLVHIKIFDILGKEIETIKGNESKAGKYQFSWKAENLASGMYFCRINASYNNLGIAENLTKTIKMILTK